MASNAEAFAGAKVAIVGAVHRPVKPFVSIWRACDLIPLISAYRARGKFRVRQLFRAGAGRGAWVGSYRSCPLPDLPLPMKVVPTSRRLWDIPQATGPGIG